jgi:plastocyanin
MGRLVLACLLFLALLAPAAQAETLHYRFGPIHIGPGRNDIVFALNDQRPAVNGWITGFKPNLIYANGKVPRVDVIHLHHGVWVVNGAPEFAAGEEKTVVRAPAGYGWRYRTTDTWLMNHMIHNLTPDATDVYITYDLDFIPDTDPRAAAMKEIRTLWLDVTGPPHPYPVFDVHRHAGGRDGRYTFPRESRRPGYTLNRYTVRQDGALLGGAGHLHPGGLWDDLYLTRGGRTVRLFRSRAHYFEPAGPVSWDVSMTATPPNWRVAVKKGDVLSVSGTYDSRRSSWYESMAIMPVAITVNPAGGADPFVRNVAVKGVLTHGHLPENDNHGGQSSGALRNASRLPDGPRTGVVDISGFLYGQGDLSSPGARGLPPVVSPGQALTFVNDDASRNIFHTITACRTPCTATTGIAYPLANGPTVFDSGELGFGPPGFTAASNRKEWQTPADLQPGTYTFFCRIHPFMRGAFRVKG